MGNVIVYVNWPSEGTRTTLHLIRADGKCDFQISNLEYVASPAWSPDGKEIGYVGPDGIYSLEVEQLAGRDIYSNLCS